MSNSAPRRLVEEDPDLAATLLLYMDEVAVRSEPHPFRMVLMYSLFIALGHVTLVGDAGLGSLAAAPAILTRVWRWLSSVLPIPQMADIIEICSIARLLCFFLGTSWAAIAATSNALELLVDVVAADSTSRDGEVRDQAVLIGCLVGATALCSGALRLPAPLEEAIDT